jgi:ribonuclease HI
MTPTLTICSDASFSHHHKIAGWACYMRGPALLVKRSGLLPTAEDPMMAECQGIANALFIADKLVDLRKHKLIYYCDNIQAMQPRPLRNTPASRYYKKAATYNLWYEEHIGQYLKRAVSFELRHVKGHMTRDAWSVTSARNFMNDWCDQEARAVVQAEIKRLASS